MISGSEELVPIPYPFKHNEKRTILAFAQSEENREKALEAGAEIALGPEVIKKVSCFLTALRIPVSSVW